MASEHTSERRRNLLVGLFMIVALAGVAVLIVLFGEMPDWLVGTRTYHVHVYFGQLRGLTIGTDVEMSSIRVGRVGGIQRRDADDPALGVDVTLDIQDPYAIPQDAVARVHEAPLGFGRPVVVLDVRRAAAGQFVPRDGSAVLEGKLVSAFDQLIPRDVVATLQRSARQIGDLAEALTPVADDLHELFVKRPVEHVDSDQSGQVIPNLYTAVHRLNESLKHFNEVLGDPEVKSNLRAAISNLRTVTEDARSAVHDLQAFATKAEVVADDVRNITSTLSGTATRTDQQLDVIGRKIVDNADKLSRVLDHLDEAARGLAQGEGTAGRFVNDPRLYESLVLTTQRLNEAIADLQNLVREWREKGVAIQGVGLR
ncbi:MAG TPA: MlaD family protein [Phycisphaerae bacterium]|nr:MlaD family protein [Phycisphaerae bacterium]